MSWVRPLDDYINKVNTLYKDAYNKGKTHDGAYGQVTDENYRAYSEDQLDQCGFPEGSDESKQLRCYNKTIDYTKELTESRENYKRVLKRATWVRREENASRIRWNTAPKRKGKAKVNSVIDRMLRCTNSIETIATDCNNHFKGGNWQTLCQKCQIPDECKPSNVDDVLDGWRDVYTVLPPDANFPVPKFFTKRAGDGTPNFSQFGDTTKDICVLSRVRGGFYGMGESISVTKTGSAAGDEWEIMVRNQRDDSAEHSAGTAACISRGKFFNGQGGGSGSLDAGYGSDTSCYLDGGSCLPSWSQKTAKVYTSSSKDTAKLLDRKYAASLAGVQGELDGEGEWISTTTNQTGPAKIVANSETGDLVALGRSWGLDSPSGSPKSGKQTSNTLSGDRTVTLKSAETHFCYLTSVSGQFDGLGEAAYVDLKGGRWRLNVRAGCDQSGGFVGLGPECKEAKPISAVARCYKYDQS